MSEAPVLARLSDRDAPKRLERPLQHEVTIMNEFAFLYRSRPSAPPSPQQMQDRMQRWNAWFKDLEKKGALANLGHPLQHTGGGVVTDKSGTVSDGPFAETKDIVMGFSVIRAEGFEQAVTLAAGCPVFEQGGVVEVRPIAKM
jgi:hypothetical protein